MDAVEELESVLTLDQAQGLADVAYPPVLERGSTTQQLLDELLGCFDDDDSPMFLAHGLSGEFHLETEE
jgi:hypothetical protein